MPESNIDPTKYSEHLSRAEYDCPCRLCQHVSPLADLLVVFEAIRGRLRGPATDPQRLSLSDSQ